MLSEYPVLEVLPELKKSLSNNNIVILQAPPGAGKSTVLPLELMHESWLADKKIIMLEPRRLAVRSVAQRMSWTLKEDIGTTVGYRIRFENKISSKTRIEVVTEGILTRMIQSDNALEDVGLIIFDEFHERSLHADLALALSLNAQQLLRNDLRILIMSATLDTINLSEKLGAPLIVSQGKQYPVEIVYNPVDDKNSPLYVSVSNAIRRALKEQDGDILVFLPGVFEIKKTLESLEASNLNASLCPLYGDLSFDKQQEAIIPDAKGRRKVVLATSIAETSLTI
jgi:ATP-dependent helicase HrpB